MVEKRLRDGTRIAQLVASEVHADPALSVVDADPDAEPTADGAFAYAVTRGGDAATRDPDAVGVASADDRDPDPDAERIAEVYVHPDRARIELLAAPAAAAEAAAAADLRVRPKAVRPPRTLAFVEDGARAKRAVGALRAATDADSDADTDADADDADPA